MSTRNLCEIAREIAVLWPQATVKGSGPFGAGTHPAQPYLEGMRCLRSVDDRLFEDSGATLVRYFLSNAAGWRGEDARRIKAELKAML